MAIKSFGGKILIFFKQQTGNSSTDTTIPYLRAGMIEHATRADIIAKRCKKVVAVISPSFCQDNKNIHDVDITTIIYLKNR